MRIIQYKKWLSSPQQAMEFSPLKYNLSPILSFDEEILKVNFGNELEYALNCKVLKDGFLLEPKENRTLTEWAPFFALSLILQYYKSFKKLPPVLMSVDTKMQEKYSQEELIQNLFQ